MFVVHCLLVNTCYTRLEGESEDVESILEGHRREGRSAILLFQATDDAEYERRRKRERVRFQKGLATQLQSWGLLETPVPQGAYADEIAEARERIECAVSTAYTALRQAVTLGQQVDSLIASLRQWESTALMAPGRSC